MISNFKNSHLVPILEAYQAIYESADDKNRKRAFAYSDQKLKEMGVLGRPVLDDNGNQVYSAQKQKPWTYGHEFIDSQIGEMIPNAKNLAKAKFMLGATRLYFEDFSKDPSRLQEKANTLNKIIKIMADGAHVNDYDFNFNGKSFDELKEQFSGSVKKALASDMENIGNGEYKKNELYTIVRIPDFETASKYGNYTSWCVTHSEDMYNNYTSDCLGIFYFCLKNGFENLKQPTAYSGSPMDEYGSSMIAISVNDDGSLNTCTCRYNHSCGGNDNMMDTQQISDFFGVNFYETFKPRDINELLEKYRENEVKDDFAEQMGWICIKEESYYNRYDYIVPFENRILKYRKVFDNGSIVGIASEHFYWYDKATGQQIERPENIKGDINCENWNQLESLIGCPLNLDGNINCSGCANLKTLDGICESMTGDFNFLDCDSLPKDEYAKLISKPSLVKTILFGKGSNAEIDENGNITALVDFDEIEGVYAEGRDGVSFSTVEKILTGDGFEVFGDYDYPVDFNNLSHGNFDEKLKEFGIDFDDIGLIYNDREDELIDEKISEDKAYEIKELLENDFYDGNGIFTVYNDCNRNGAEAEAYEDCKNEVFDSLCLDKEYGIRDGKVKVVLSKDMVVSCFKEYNPEEDDSIFKMIRSDGGDIDNICVFEPQYGWSGFDEAMWKEAVDGFGDKVYDIMSTPPKVEDSEGQQYFEFDKDYLDNPRNRRRK